MAARNATGYGRLNASDEVAAYRDGRQAGQVVLIAQLTSLRFFAAMAVFVFHAGAGYLQTVSQVPTFVQILVGNGYLGVPFFFVLSGFVLQYVYGAGLGQRAAVGRYLLARFARIYPVYLLGILAMAPFATPRGWADLPQFVLLQHWVPSALYSASEWNLPAWTLSVELFFYLAFPLLTKASRRLGAAALWGLLAVLLLIVALSESAATVDLSRAPGWIRYLPIPLVRLPEFAIGVAAGELHRRGIGLPIAIPGWLLVATFLALMSLSPDRRMSSVVVLFSATIIISFAQRPQDPTARLLKWRPLVLLGGASYALYLLHIPLHETLDLIVDGNRWAMLAQYPLAILLSVAVFRWYEEPLRDRIRRLVGIAPSTSSGVARVTAATPRAHRVGS